MVDKHGTELNHCWRGGAIYYQTVKLEIVQLIIFIIWYITFLYQI